VERALRTLENARWSARSTRVREHGGWILFGAGFLGHLDIEHLSEAL